MAKTLPPGEISIPGVAGSFSLNAVPDVFDERDLEYRPRLEPLPRLIDNRDQDKAFYVLEQKGNSCTGHAVAGVINTILAHQTRRELEKNGGQRAHSEDAWLEMPRISPYMLYYLARRYDEFEGEEDLGSSLRGAFKGWFNHGACLEPDWPELDFEADLDEADFVRKCRERPLGAYYRINPYRLDDMQSAIWELEAIAVSAAIHDGWTKPAVLQNQRGEEMRVIRRSRRPRMLGGHAFILVGYNEVGFLVQNSWGPKWGKGGFATLPYEDWLDSAYDAWVARPGVPHTPFYSGRAKTFAGTNGALVLGKGPDLKRLANYVVNLGNDGRLSTTGKFRSSPAQIERIFNHMESQHSAWEAQDPQAKRQVVLYAHGGLVAERTALDQAQASMNWWLNNRIYPIFFAWQTGPAETLFNQIFDMMKLRLPAGGLGFDLEEQFDRLVEKLVRQNFIWAWDQMKQNARAASATLPMKGPLSWPTAPKLEARLMRMPGASLLVSRLAQYIQAQGEDRVAVHLVGHSAGSIFHAGLLKRLVRAEIPVESITFLAPGLRVDEFMRDIYPHLGPDKTVKRFTVFNLSHDLEMSDTCSQGGTVIYHKSLLYLVARALERPPQRGMFETPLLGLERSFDLPARIGSKETLRELLEAVGGEVVFSRSVEPADRRCEAETHGAFDNDPATMTSVLLRFLGRRVLDGIQDFKENLPLAGEGTPAAPPVREGKPAGSGQIPSEGPPKGPPRMAAAPTSSAEQPQAAEVSFQAPAAEAPPTPSSGSPIVDLLQEQGWVLVE